MNKKNLIIEIKKDSMLCSFEEVLEMYEPLIKSIVNSWRSFGEDDIRQTCLIALWKAFDKYDISYEISFGFYARKAMLNSVYCYTKKTNIYNKNNCSYENISEHSDYLFDKPLTFQDLLKSDVELENDYITQNTIETYIKYMPRKYKQLFQLIYINGLNQREASEVLRLTQPAVNYQLKHVSVFIKKISELDNVLNYINPRYREYVAELYITDSLLKSIDKKSIKEIYTNTSILESVNNSIVNKKDINMNFIDWLQVNLKALRSLVTELNELNITMHSKLGRIV